MLKVLILCCFMHLINGEDPVFVKHEKKMSEYVLKVLDHFQQEDPVGIPGAPIPEPLKIPPLSKSFSLGKMNFMNVELFGLSKFRIEYIKADITNMTVEIALRIEQLNVYGNYTLNTWVSSAKGPFTVKLTDVFCKAIATLEVERSGFLEAQDMNMDITFKGISLNFKGLGVFASMFQGIINSVGTFIFDSIKPFILKEVNTNLRKDVNAQTRKLPQKFPNSISPFDQLISEVRRRMRTANLDPYKVADYNNSVGVFDVELTNTWLYGLSSIHRFGDIIFEVKNNTVYALLEVGSQKIQGSSNWEIALVAGFMAQSGTITFTTDYIKVQISLSQTMDTRNSPKLEDVQLELGNIQVRFDGAGSVDYLIELGINVIPNLLRYQIMDALEHPLKQRIQAELNNINIERLVKENVNKIDNPGSVELF